MSFAPQFLPSANSSIPQSGDCINERKIRHSPRIKCLYASLVQSRFVFIYNNGCAGCNGFTTCSQKSVTSGASVVLLPTAGARSPIIQASPLPSRLPSIEDGPGRWFASRPPAGPTVCEARQRRGIGRLEDSQCLMQMYMRKRDVALGLG